MNSIPEFLTPEDVAKILKVSYHTALDIIRVNRIYVKIGRQYRVPKAEFEKLLFAKGRKLL